jgi:hypothetical protein
MAAFRMRARVRRLLGLSGASRTALDMLLIDWTDIAPDVLRCDKAEISQAGAARQGPPHGKPLA